MDHLRGEPSVALVATALGLIWLYLFADASRISGLTDAANLVGPLLLGIVAMGAGIRLVVRDPLAMWTPYAWFIAFVVLFCSVGSLIYPLASHHTLYAVQSFIPITSQELLRTNLLDTVGILALLAGFRVARTFGHRLVYSFSSSTAPAANLNRIAGVFLLVGGVLRFLWIVPYEFGLTHSVIPGVIVNLGDLFLLGLMIVAFLVARGAKSWRVPFYLLWSIQIIVALLSFSKKSLLLSIVAPVMASYLGNPKILRLAIWIVVIAFIYFSMENLIAYGRQEILAESHGAMRATLIQRARIVGDWFSHRHRSNAVEVSSAESGWARLNYASVQVFAMTRYDEGYPGHTLRDAAIIFIPRFLWPHKPIVTNAGIRFYRLVTGHRSTSLGLGIYGEGYWDYGWVGVIGLAFVTGMIFSVMGQFAMNWIRREAFEYLPAVFLGIVMGGLGLTGLFVTSVMGGLGFFIVYAILIWFLKQVLGTNRTMHA